MKKPTRVPDWTARRLKASRLRDLAFGHESSARIHRARSGERDIDRIGWANAHAAIARVARKEAARLDRLDRQKRRRTA